MCIFLKIWVGKEKLERDSKWTKLKMEPTFKKNKCACSFAYGQINIIITSLSFCI